MPTKRKITSPAVRKRVLDLLDAIAKLHKGDLLNILDLDRCIPLIEIGENDTFQLDENGRVIHMRRGPVKKSLRHRPQTGEELARIMEAQLEAVLIFGEAVVPSIQARTNGTQLGGRTFKW